METFDLVVIGGGSAGMKAARTARKLGATVTLAEQRELGGECFWAGCVPTKAMIRAAEVWSLVGRAHEFGMDIQIVNADYRRAMEYKDRAVRAVGGDGPEDAGLSNLGIRYFPTRATFRDPHLLQIGAELVRAEKVIIATGTIPFVPHVEGLLETGFITNREAVHLETLPRRLAVLGGGPIGLEFSQIYRRFGTEVTVIELGPQILPQEDAEIAELVTSYLREENIRVIAPAEVMQVERSSEGKRLTVRVADAIQQITVDEILVATGRAAATGDLDLDAAGVCYSQRAIGVDHFLRTNQPHIWVAGDASGGYLFTHVASHKGWLAAHNAFEAEPIAYDSRVVPRCTFVDPEIASIGLTERAAVESGLDVAVHRSSLSDLDRAILHNDARGVVKIVADRKSGEVLGGHIVAAQASAMIAEIALAMQHRLPVSAIAETMHAYPSFPEAVEAAALAAPVAAGMLPDSGNDDAPGIH